MSSNIINARVYKHKNYVFWLLVMTTSYNWVYVFYDNK